ncbi:hypothetical protein BDB00DRAFT_843465 [Zychaea mexicana]|uniref:uncharacterized protein n=1 Tax=Zychaea mexicana TaxID=64656 RepID=UPI0022FEB0B7|nr:uncharacterized protein BDB00DRAFT_843465 [Zychaea mexicana]KAI9489361.1 hypothetical protein BDB00DRAFT_843465 [Zychaea mexicana]
MNPLASCIPKRRRQPILLPDDSEDDENDRDQQQYNNNRSCMPLWPFTQCLGPRHGRVALGEDDNTSSRILNQYLDPNTTVGIEPLLAQHASDSIDDDNDPTGPNALFSAAEPHRFLSRNPFATASTTTALGGVGGRDDRRALPEQQTDYLYEDDDAQFLSDHRISAVISDRAKITADASSNSSNNAYAEPVLRTEEEEEREKRTSRTVEYYNQELIDVAPKTDRKPTTEQQSRELKDMSGPSALRERELDDFGNPSMERELKDFGDNAPSPSATAERELADFSTSSPQQLPAKELKSFSSNALAEQELADINNSSSSSSLLSSPPPPPPAARELQDFNSSSPTPFIVDRELTSLDNKRVNNVSTIGTMAVSTSELVKELKDFKSPLSYEPEEFDKSISNNNVAPIATTTTAITTEAAAAAALVPPPHESEVQQQQPRESRALTTEGQVDALQSMSQPPSPRPEAHDMAISQEINDERSGAGTSDRRSSVAVVAQSILGDRLDDFTEKLAFIKKNIIMSLEDEDGWDEDQQHHHQQQLLQGQQIQQQQPADHSKRRPSYDPLMSNSTKTTSSASFEKPRHHKRSSSFMEVAGKFMSQLNQAAMENSTNHNGNPNADSRIFSPSSFFATLADPEGDRSDNDNISITEGQHRQREDLHPFSSTAQRDNQERQHHHHHQRTMKPSWADDVPEEDEEGERSNNDEEEDLFDFGKMLAVGKNVRNIGEDMVGNGLRMFNDMASRVKNANKQPVPGENDDSWMLDRDAWM